jgi:outer membrane lipoprotein carrier protein
MRKVRVVVGLLAALAATVPCVMAQTAEEVLSRVREKYETIQDAELKFSQTVRFPVSKAEQHLSGTLLMKKGNRYRVETDDMVVVTDGKTVWSHSRVNNQVLIDNFRLDDRAYSPERILLAAPADFTPTLTAREKSGKADLVVLKLLPTDQHGYIRSLKLWVNDADHMIKKVEMTDANDKETTYIVNDLRINRGLGDARFTYPIPEGVEVVDLR